MGLPRVPFEPIPNAASQHYPQIPYITSLYQKIETTKGLCEVLTYPIAFTSLKEGFFETAGIVPSNLKVIVDDSELTEDSVCFH